MFFGRLKSGGTATILGVVFAIFIFQGCIMPPIRETNHENPPPASGRDFSPSAVVEPGDDHEERSEAAAAEPAAAEPLASTDAAEEIIPSDTPAKEGDRLNSTGDQPAEALQRVLSLCKLSQIEWKQGELERAIETLDQAYALLLSVDPGNTSSLFQEKEDLRIVISRRMLEIYSSRLVVANGKRRNEIPLIINRHVQDEIEAFTTGRERDFFISAYRRSGRYRAKIEAALQTAGLPIELAWLPLVESGFKVTAFSPARALGLWQFIPSTGYRYNLYRNRYIDERLDVEKSTRGAIEYLKELHAMFGDWTTVLAAYNCGEHRVLRTIQSQSVNYLDNFWDLYERLPRETARYVPRFLATLHIVQNLEEFGLNDIAVDPELQYESAAVFRQTSLKSIARTTGIDAELLRELNAELRRGILPPDGYDLRVPLGRADLVASHASDFPIQSVRVDAGTDTHKVRRGETFSSIGKRYGVPVKRLMSANGIYNAKKLKIGNVLRIPSAHPSAVQTVAARRPRPTGRTIEYVVRPGDSLFKIAKRFATTTDKIQRLNKMPTTSLSVGQILKIQPAV